MNDHNAFLQVRTQAALCWLGTLAPLAALAAGCVYAVPVPTAYHPAGSRRNLTEDRATRFAPGSTTVDDVVLALGEPDESAPDASRLTYYLVSGIDYTFGQEEGCNEDCIQADVG
jgi:hypothetical protein